jgi:ferredoxin-NADP reductase
MTPRVKQFVLEADRTFEYEPGQHTTLHFENSDGDEETRPYTPTRRWCRTVLIA